MPKLLVVQASPRGDLSKSRLLAADFLSEWKEKYPGNDTKIRDLDVTDLTFVDMGWIRAAFTPSDQRTVEMKAALALSNELIAELKWADHVLISTPMHNFTVPARLKAWIDQIVRVGETFTWRSEGLLTGKKVTAIVASGSEYTADSLIADRNFVAPVLTTALDFIGIKGINFILAGNTKGIDMGQISVDTYREMHRPALKAAA